MTASATPGQNSEDAMSATTANTYEVRVAGHLDQHWTGILSGLSLSHEPDGTSTLTGPIVDQAHLHGILTAVQSIGATLLALTPVNTSGGSEREREQTPPLPLERVTWPVHTPRLTLRPAQPKDADATWQFRRLEQVGRWLTEIPTDLETYRATFNNADRLATTLVIEHDGAVIGDLMLRVEDAWAQAEVATDAAGTQAELGWVLDPGHTGAGYATEAVRELLDICFSGLGLRRVTATCFGSNEASWRLMERLGMRRELHAVTDALPRSGEWADTYRYALLATEWGTARTAHRRATQF